MKFAALVLIAAAVSLPAQEILHSFTTVPTPISHAEPQYTQDALDAKLQGEVRIAATIGVDGVPTEIKVVQGLGHGLDEKAIECLQQWRFKPGMKDGAAIATKATIAISFRLPQTLPAAN